MITYFIDNVQLFKQVLFVEGWAFSTDAPVTPRLIYADLALDADYKLIDRADVASIYPGAPLSCGFQLRCIVCDIESPADVKILLDGDGQQLLLSKPAEQASTFAYKPLSDLSEKFFSRVRQNAGAKALEIGARARSGLARRDAFGSGVEYTGFDIRSGENVDVVGDAHQLTQYFEPSTFDFAYSVSVFEHLMWPWKVALELSVVMKVGGWALMQSHPAWPKHEMPWDFFRYWDSGWRALFCEATGFQVLDTVEALGVDLVSRQYTSSQLNHWEGDHASLASAVLAQKIGDAKVRWDAIPNLADFGGYPF